MTRLKINFISNMSKQKLSFLIGFPLFGISFFFMPESLQTLPILSILSLINIVPIIMIWIFDFIIRDLPNTNIDSDHIIYPIFIVIFNIIFWLPVGFLANLRYERYKARRKNQTKNN